MANLGDNNTPVEGESFGLPSGFSIDEENGDLVIRDTDGTVAMRRADGTWELESDLALNENDISGVGAFDSESVNTGALASDERAGWGEPVIDVSEAPDTPTFSFALDSPLDEGEEILINISQIGTESSGTEIRLNVDELDDNRFWYRKSNEPATGDANHWFLTDIPTGNMGFSGDLILRETRFDTAVLPNVTIAETEGQVIQEAGCDDTGAQNFEIELIDVGGDEFINLDFKVYRREVFVR